MKRRQLLAGGGVLAVAGAGATALALRRTATMEAYNAAAAAERAPLLERPETKSLIRYATLAASGHNTQPWRFRIGEDRIEILPDFSRRTAVVDPDDHHLFVSMGCAAENLSIAAGAVGQPGELRFDPTGDGSVVFEPKGGTAARSRLIDAIPRRQSSRTDYDGQPIETADLKALTAAAVIPGVDLMLLTSRPQLERVRELVIAGNSAQMADPAFVQELKTWLRFNPQQATETGDGLFTAASGIAAVPSWLGPVAFDWFSSPGTENDRYARQLRSSSGVAVFVAQHEDRDHWVRVGRACQRFALQATLLGMKHAFINQPVEVAHLRPELASLVGMPGRRPNIVMRFGHGPGLPFSPRRPVEAVLA